MNLAANFGDPDAQEPGAYPSPMTVDHPDLTDGAPEQMLLSLSRLSRRCPRAPTLDTILVPDRSVPVGETAVEPHNQRFERT